MQDISVISCPVRLINVEGDSYRLNSSLNTLDRLGFTSVEVFSAPKNKDPVRGCADSHLRVLTEMKGHEQPYIVLEDDIAPHSFRREISLPATADAAYLGNSDYGLVNGVGKRRIALERHSSELFRLYNMLSSHAIMYLNQDYAEAIIRGAKFARKHGHGVDKSMAETMKYWEVYAFENPLFKQAGKHANVTVTELGKHSSVGPDKVYAGMGRFQIFGKIVL